MRKLPERENVLVELHCHSDISDGYYPPGALMEILAGKGVEFAALTDHKSGAGFESFRKAAIRHHIGVISGAEIHSIYKDEEIHFLAYGFDPEHPAFQRAAASILDAEETIAALHESGAIVILAHPLQTKSGPDPEALKGTITELAQAGLDGIEAFYKAYPEEEQKKLVALADQYALLAIGGSDFHGHSSGERTEPGIELPLERWKQFRRALGGKEAEPAEADSGIRRPEKIEWKRLALKTALPSILVLLSFMILIFAGLVPAMEERLLDRRREMTMELTNSAWSILMDYHREYLEGSMDIEEAQEAATSRIRRLRYGPEGIDYFWITDMHPRMIMHPYRSDLEGEDLTHFTDPEGARPFIQFVEAVRSRNSGFVRYVWQWQDDPDRFAAKESYVRGFEPWNWIIGTGLYVDDVMKEIDAITGRMIDASFLVTAMAAILLMTIAWQSLKTEKRRSRAAHELHLSHERYRTLVEASNIGTLLLIQGRCTYANTKLLETTGYTGEEIAWLDVHDIITTKDQGPGYETAAEQLDQICEGEEVREPFETRLKKKDATTVPILLSATGVFFSGRKGLLLSIQDISGHRSAHGEAERDRLVVQLQTSLMFLTEPVHKSMDPLVSCPMDTPVRQAVRLLNRHDSDALAVIGPKNELLGIVTDHDIRKRVVAEGFDIKKPISRIMSAPVISINEYSPLYEALLLESERSIEHIAVTDDTGKPRGMLRASKTVRPDHYSLVLLTQRIRRAEGIEELSELTEGLSELVETLSDSGTRPQNICHVTSSVSDAVTKRIVALAIAELGPAPTRFAFVAMGSEARREQTLATDQDNAIIYEDIPEEGMNGKSKEDTGRYFLQLGEFICNALDRVGYSFCRGSNMAKNPEWNRPLSSWKNYFSNWIKEPDEQALAYCNVFFDLRCVAGDPSLPGALHLHIDRLLSQRPAFLSYMALNTLRYKIPVNVFGRIVTESSDQAGNTFNIKEAMLPIVNFARLYTLQHRIEETNTVIRLEQLHSAGILQDESFRALLQAYTFLMQLRFRHQTDCIREGGIPDNGIDPDTLTQIDTGMLKRTLSQISVIQKKVAFDFQVSG